jgi:hypothetical protein
MPEVTTDQFKEEKGPSLGPTTFDQIFSESLLSAVKREVDAAKNPITRNMVSVHA